MTAHSAALVIAALSALGFAMSASLQHHANTRGALEHAATGRRQPLIRRPRWLVGQGVSLAAFGLHAWALGLGNLVVVQPVVVSGVVLAIPIHAVSVRRLPRAGELLTVTLTAIGLATFLVACTPSPSGYRSPGLAGVATAVAVLVALAGSAWALTTHGVRRATGYGFAAGALFGVTAGLVKLATAYAAHGHGTTGHLWALATAWPTWAASVTGLCGVALNQLAYRSGPLSASMPLLNTVDVLIAILFGVVVFREIPAHHPVQLLAQAAALCLMGFGLVRLARYHSDADAMSVEGRSEPPRADPRIGRSHAGS